MTHQLKLNNCAGCTRKRSLLSRCPTYKGIICLMCVLALLRTVRFGMTKFGNQAKPLKYSEKIVSHTNLEQMFKRMATDLDTQPTTKQQRLTCALKNTRLLPDGFSCRGDIGNEILFRIRNSPPITTFAGLDD